MSQPAGSAAVPDIPNPFSIRIYWEDTDAGGVVFYANYLKFFERARTEWLRAAGVEQQALRDTTGAIFIVAEVQMRYLAPAKLDDLITVSVQVVEQGAASMALVQEAWRGDTLLAQGRIRIGCVRAETLKPRRIPAQVLQAIGATSSSTNDRTPA
ncbi:tol-pal system-associated acyl-CoA thioesterase [Rhodoferax sp. TS-BS-61-7]|uniref:tol-pal system-associated acyl-CoA thioesterase n=1 Tax=Rhodoferax sp. TS-BS-61-7 TaxID=2094194 RepID=UPI000CF6BEE7|nr:tol-pal system-associated acyl-CoA thioesterase [Rhodoferax sp. TS-BS-61-7]PQA75747.1 tol-pal system-associated acyl-CoA thioesterase [Rhodoferax sp. TS-BS-61-7]